MVAIKTKVIGLLVTGLSMVGCHSSQNHPEFKTIHITPDRSEIRLSEIFSELTPVQLETTDFSLIGHTDKSQLTSTKFYIRSENTLLIFNRNGKFIRKFDQSGKGPAEYNSMTDFLIDEEQDEILILDGWQHKLLIYDLQGEFRKEYPLEFYANNLIRHGKDIYLYSGNSTTPENPYKIQRLKNYQLEASFYPADEHKKEYLHVRSSCNFYPGSEGILFFEAFNDTIYTVTADNVLPLYVISWDQNKKNIPASFYEKKFSDIREFFTQFHQMNYVNSTYNVVETADNLFFDCYYSGNKHLNIYHKSTGKGSSYTTVTDDMLGNQLSVPYDTDEFRFQGVAGKEEILFFIPAWHLLEHTEKITSGKLKEITDNLQEDDNPVLMIGKL